MTIITESAAPMDSPDSAGLIRAGGPTWADFHALEERVQKQGARYDTWTLFICAFAAIAVLFSVIGVGFGSRAIDESKRNVSAAPASAAAVSPIPVQLSEFELRPASTTIAAGKVTLQISNAGKVQHELLVFRSALAPAAYPMRDGDINEDGSGITKVSDGDNLDPGASQTRSVDLSTPGTYLFVCNLPGHFKAGMHTVITVK